MIRPLIFWLILTVSFMKPGFVMAQQKTLEARVDSVLALMTLEEKAGQLSLFTNDWDETGTFIRKEYADFISNGLAGGVFNAYGAEYTRRLQELAVNTSRLGIPLIFGYDVIHVSGPYSRFRWRKRPVGTWRR